MKKIIILHGPNLNLLGERDKKIYGSLTLRQINQKLKAFALAKKVTLRIFQSNSEGALIDFMHKNRKWAQGLVINPAAYTHSSYALRDSIEAMPFPSVEVHLSDIKKREKFRKISITAPVCVKQISGLGWKSYTEGVKFLLKYVD